MLCNGKRRHCWLRFKRHSLKRTGSVSMVPKGFHLLGYGGDVRRCRSCGWETTTAASPGEQKR